MVPKLPAPVEPDLAKGILEAIDMDSYRVEKQSAMKIQLTDEDAEIEPVPTTGGGHKPEPELDLLSNIIETGLYLRRARYLDPHAGRYLQRDRTAGHGGALYMGSACVYEGNNPWSP